MKVVQPIRDKAVLQRCFEIAREHDANRRDDDRLSWELLLVVGFNTSLRISDLVKFRVGDLRGQDYARVIAQKTGKEARILINPAARKAINRLTAGRDTREWAFLSRQKDNLTLGERAISRQRAYQIINAIGRAAGVKDRIGCHTLRKTFGFHYYKMTGDIVSLQRILCHSSSRDTLVYIGIIDEEIDESLKRFRLVGE